MSKRGTAFGSREHLGTGACVTGHSCDASAVKAAIHLAQGLSKVIGIGKTRIGDEGRTGHVKCECLGRVYGMGISVGKPVIDLPEGFVGLRVDTTYYQPAEGEFLAIADEDLTERLLGHVGIIQVVDLRGTQRPIRINKGEGKFQQPPCLLIGRVDVILICQVPCIPCRGYGYERIKQRCSVS